MKRSFSMATHQENKYIIKKNDPLSNYYPTKILDRVHRNIVYPSAEHYYQAQKFPQFPFYMKIISEATTPQEAINLANLFYVESEAEEDDEEGVEEWEKQKEKDLVRLWQQRQEEKEKEQKEQINHALKKGVYIRLDFERVREKIMYEAVWEKFTQQQNTTTYPQDLKTSLLETGERELIYDCRQHHYNYYWGYEPKAKQGNNNMGFLLMTIRKELRFLQ